MVAYLRPQYRSLVEPNSYLNEIRLVQWRELFSRHWPGVTFRLRPERDPAIRDALARLRRMANSRSTRTKNYCRSTWSPVGQARSAAPARSAMPKTEGEESTIGPPLFKRWRLRSQALVAVVVAQWWWGLLCFQVLGRFQILGRNPAVCCDYLPSAIFDRALRLSPH